MLLGIDYGKRKIGLALSEGLYASSAGTVVNTESRIQQIKEKISEPLDLIVIGLPGSIMDNDIKFFGNQLKNQFTCEIHYENEFNTTQEAQLTMIRSGVKQKKRRSDDSMAATTILQRYIDTHPL